MEDLRNKLCLINIGDRLLLISIFQVWDVRPLAIPRLPISEEISWIFRTLTDYDMYHAFRPHAHAGRDAQGGRPRTSSCPDHLHHWATVSHASNARGSLVGKSINGRHAPRIEVIVRALSRLAKNCTFRWSVIDKGVVREKGVRIIENVRIPCNKFPSRTFISNQ